MKAYKCDRCGKTYVQNPRIQEEEFSWIVGVKLVRLSKGRRDMSIDLCEDCLKKAIKFFENSD